MPTHVHPKANAWIAVTDTASGEASSATFRRAHLRRVDVRQSRHWPWNGTRPLVCTATRCPTRFQLDSNTRSPESDCMDRRHRHRLWRSGDHNWSPCKSKVGRRPTITALAIGGTCPHIYQPAALPTRSKACDLPRDTKLAIMMHRGKPTEHTMMNKRGRGRPNVTAGINEKNSLPPIVDYSLDLICHEPPLPSLIYSRFPKWEARKGSPTSNADNARRRRRVRPQ
ncbi:hypothetical protein AKJ16_DCAP23837 [Drosera capensis]